MSCKAAEVFRFRSLVRHRLFCRIALLIALLLAPQGAFAANYEINGADSNFSAVMSVGFAADVRTTTLNKPITWHNVGNANVTVTGASPSGMAAVDVGAGIVTITGLDVEDPAVNATGGGTIYTQVWIFQIPFNLGYLIESIQTEISRAAVTSTVPTPDGLAFSGSERFNAASSATGGMTGAFAFAIPSTEFSGTTSLLDFTGEIQSEDIGSTLLFDINDAQNVTLYTDSKLFVPEINVCAAFFIVCLAQIHDAVITFHSVKYDDLSLNLVGHSALDPTNELDPDGDGILSDVDNCPETYNFDQLDTDGDGIGDVCEPDSDGDGVIDDDDNCPLISNPDQIDTDGNGVGDACPGVSGYWSIIYDLGSPADPGTTFVLTDTPLMAGDGVINIGPGTLTLEFESDSHGISDGEVRLTQLDYATAFAIAGVTTDQNAELLGEAVGTLADGVITWDTPMTDYHYFGWVTCNGAICVMVPGLDDGVPVWKEATLDLDLADFVFENVNPNALGGFEALWTEIPNPDPATTYVQLRGTEDSRTFVPDAPLDADADGDGVDDADDNCVYEPNPGQEDVGGVANPGDPSGLIPDGIGDACQCGDVDGDGKVTGVDEVVLNRDLAGLPPGLTSPQKCVVIGTECNGVDATIIARAVQGLPPGILQLCEAALP